jgi:DNA invertase Pin-like site-specific DNA recombinase
MELVGYARVSTREEWQVFDRQLDALKAAGCKRIFDDRGSGASADRPGLKACLNYLREGDVLVVLDLDRLGRLAGELIRLVDELEGRGVGFRALNTSFDTTTPVGRAFLQIQAAFAEMERNVIRQRVKEGIAAARARGRKGGRPRLMTPERLRYAQHLMADKSRSIPAICRELGSVPASTLYHYLHADGTLKAPGVRLLGAGRAADERTSQALPCDPPA